MCPHEQATPSSRLSPPWHCREHPIHTKRILASFSFWHATIRRKDTGKNTMKCVGVSGAQPFLIFGKHVAWVPCEPASGPKRITTSARRTPRPAVKSVKANISFTWFSGSRVTCSVLSFFLPALICTALPLSSTLLAGRQRPRRPHLWSTVVSVRRFS